jgi:Asp-tRNA(Asn)/Glu-tRNA(Gln) amidotransferase A subunit family amidase
VPAANLWLAVCARARALGRAPRPDDVEPLTWEWMQEAQRFTAADYMEAVNTMHTLGRRVADFLGRYDLILSSTLAMPPIPLGFLDTTTRDVEAYVTRCFGHITPLTPLFNQTGGAAMTVPLYHSDEGLPIGVQFGGGLGDEPKLLRLAAQLEAAAPWDARRPALVTGR